MRASDIRSFDPIRYGAYICLSVPAASQAAAADADVPALAERLGLRSEYGSAGGDPPQSIAYLRRVRGRGRPNAHPLPRGAGAEAAVSAPAPAAGHGVPPPAARPPGPAPTPP